MFNTSNYDVIKRARISLGKNKGIRIKAHNVLVQRNVLSINMDVD